MEMGDLHWFCCNIFAFYVFLIATLNMHAAVKLKYIFNQNNVKSYAWTMFKIYFDVENDDSS